ncbi:hypothetical protein OMW55_01900 [Sphingomonas sp. BN140010]|uniref:Uncharacterized protein n=1 Tax=Sphingomonas arvum TaxID=2992113 RepID=A0ABT3JBW9_9SPHN|nr:XrtV sorting system accessory protein [Sphingomonas sp. BN140010]MCW3796562.1 hypothetical protein [Sphingomonas sp. BN140010]
METPFDWITVGLFAALVTHFLAHSARDDGEDIHFVHYLVPSAGCALANWLGNHEWTVAAVAVLLAGAGYAWRFLVRPGLRPPTH